MGRQTLAAAVLVAGPCLMFVPLLMYGGFVLDDVWYVLGNPQLLDWEGLKAIWSWDKSTRLRNTAGIEYQYWPLTYTSYWLDHELWGGFSGPGFHATTVAIHCATAWMAWRVLVQLKVPGAMAVAAVFAMHPGQLDALGQIIGRKDVLSTGCVVAALLVWSRERGERGWGRSGAAAALLTAGVLSKTTAGVGVALLVLVHGWQRYGWSRREVVKLAAATAAPCAVAAWAVLVHLEEMGNAGYREYGQAQRLMMGAVGWWTHLWYSLVPDPAGLGWKHWTLGWSNARVVLSMAGLAGGAAGLWVFRKRLPRAVPYAAAGFTIALAPYLGVLDNNSLPASMHNARYRYLAVVFPWMPVAAVWMHWESGWANEWRRRARRMVGVLAASGALLVNWDYGFGFSGSAAWWAHLERTSLGHSSRTVGTARNVHVLELLVEGRIEEAVGKARKQHERYPDAPRTRFMLATALDVQGQLGDEEAGEEAHRLLSGVIDEWFAPENRGRSLGRDGPWGIVDGGWGPQSLQAVDLRIALENLARQEREAGESRKAEATDRLKERIRPGKGKRGWILRGVGGGMTKIEALDTFPGQRADVGEADSRKQAVVNERDG